MHVPYRTCLLLCLLLSVTNSAATETSWCKHYTEDQLNNKILHFRKMQIGGILLLCGGVAAAVSGGILTAKDGWTTVSGVALTFPAPKGRTGEIGFGLICLSLPAFGGGTAMTVIGTRKVREYSDCLENINLQVRRNQIGLVSTWNF